MLPLRCVRHAVLMTFLADRCGRASFPAAFADLAGRGLSRGRVVTTLEELADAGRVRVRPGGTFFVVEACEPPPAARPPAPLPRGPYCR